jgi:hypothetical protein
MFQLRPGPPETHSCHKNPEPHQGRRQPRPPRPPKEFMKRPMTDPLDEKINKRNSSTRIVNDRRVGRRMAMAWFSLVAFGFLLGIITGHLLFGR